MKILISAYACEPGKGSEPGIGWHWARTLVLMGHEVWVVTRSNNQPAIDAAVAGQPWAARLHFAYFDLGRLARRAKKLPFGTQWYYGRWQRAVAPLFHSLHAAHRFDAAQHLTFGVFRTPSALGQLGIPWVFGPVGGGEFAPAPLRAGFPLRGRLIDALRDMLIRRATHSRALARCLQSATQILVKTPQTLAALPAAVRARARCQLEIGLEDSAIVDPAGLRPVGDGPLRLLFIGRFVYLKGGDLALEALADALLAGADAELTFVGQGPERGRWMKQAERLGIADKVAWIDWLPRDDLPAMYARHHALLFPSLHDSSGNVVLEAMAHGLAVICLDIGGPAQIVDVHSAVLVPALTRRRDEVVAGLAQAIVATRARPAACHSMRVAAVKRARSMVWACVVTKVWATAGAD